jgi:hypothetical protein
MDLNMYNFLSEYYSSVVLVGAECGPDTNQ